jgi:pilus assembly protein CpaE
MGIFLLRGSKEEGAIETGLRATIPDLVEVTSFSPILESESAGARDAPATVLVVAPRGDHGYFDRLVEIAAKHQNELFLILISDEISASNYKRLVRTGGAEWVSAKAASREVVEIITRRRQQETLSAKHLSPSPRLQPVTVSFVPSAGGVGNTTLVIESASYIKTNKATQHRNVCIVDLDFQTSHVCDYLDREARLHIAEFSNAPERLDEHLLESFRTRHDCGIDIFAAPRSKFPAENMSIHALDVLLSMIAKRYDLIFIDFPLTWFSWTAQVVAACDGAIITGLNTIPNLRQTSETLALVRASGSALKIGIALNRCEKNFFGSVAARKQVERVLPTEQLFFINNYAEAIESVNMGVSMVLGSSTRKMRDAFADLASFCVDLKSSHVVSL